MILPVPGIHIPGILFVFSRPLLQPLRLMHMKRVPGGGGACSRGVLMGRPQCRSLQLSGLHTTLKKMLSKLCGEKLQCPVVAVLQRKQHYRNGEPPASTGQWLVLLTTQPLLFQRPPSWFLGLKHGDLLYSAYSKYIFYCY